LSLESQTTEVEGERHLGRVGKPVGAGVVEVEKEVVIMGRAKPRRQEVKAEWARWTKPSGTVPSVHHDAQ